MTATPPPDPAAHEEVQLALEPVPDEAAAAPAVALPGTMVDHRWWRPLLTPETLFVPLAIAGLALALAVLSDSFLTQGNITNILTQMATLAIVAFGVTIVMIGGNFDLSVGSQVAVHGSLAAIVMVHTDSIILGVLAGVATGAVFGLVNGWLVAGLSINPFIATLGTLVTGRGIALAITDTRPVTGLPPELTGFGLDRPLGLPWLVWLMAGMFVVAVYVLHISPYGLRVFAVGGNREAARLSGIRVRRVVITSFVLSGVFAAVAGIAVAARLRSGQPTVGGFLELFAVAAVVLGGSSLFGGRGAVWRTLLGVSLIAIIQNGLNLLNVSTPFQQIVIGAVFIAAASAEWVRTLTLRRRR